ncbi:MAG TPA: M14 family zinc carboxypeptidase, partial [Bacteroidales bacterium]|nr:M14 family zinc carboxypeptidase [Bacteroidales bacterium]
MYRSISVYPRPALWLLVNLCLYSATLFYTGGLAAQEQKTSSYGMAQQLLAGRGEVILRFAFPDAHGLEYLSSFLSIDNYRNDTVTAYANEAGFRQFLELQISFQVVRPPSLRSGDLEGKRTGMAFGFDRYPAYQEYISIMEGFAAGFPLICQLAEFGTSKNGKKLLALKISDNAVIREQEPVFFYSSTMHGDEVVGYVLMLRLIRYLLENYETDGQVKRLLDGLEIWINPLSNPDGTYFLSDTSVAGATRFNGNQTDLNRDFPDLRDELWDIRPKEPETHAMMDFM